MVYRIIVIIFITVNHYLLIADPGKELLKAKQAVEDNNLGQALTILKNALKTYPEDHDLLTYQARIYSWQNKRDSAHSILSAVDTLYPNDKEYFEIKCKLFEWNQQWDSLYHYAKKYADIFPEERETYFLRIKAMTGLGLYKEAIALGRNLEDPAENERFLLDEAKSHYYQFIQLGVTHFAFSGEEDPWDYYTLKYGQQRNFPWNISTTVAKRFGLNGWKVGFEGYPRITKNLYAEVIANYSSSPIFPAHALGGTAYYTYSRLEISGGMRQSAWQARQFFLGNSSVGVYLGSFYCTLGALVNLNDIHSSNSYRIKTRYYFSTDHLLEFNAYRGNVPVTMNGETIVSTSHNQFYTLSYKRRFKSITSQIQLGLQQEEFSETTRNATMGSFTLQYRY